MNRKKIEAYIPLLKTTKQYTRKIKTYFVPLINCYAFVNITKDQYISVLQTEYVFKFIRQRNDLLSIPEEEIFLLKKIVGEFQEDISINENQFVDGEEVEVISGNLTGLKGKLVTRKNKNEFVVELQHIGVRLNLCVNTSLIRPVNQLIKV